MARAQIMAAGGIVLRREQPPRVAVVRLRKRDEWVLPKGKLDDGETPRDAAKREVLEETGHKVTVHEFLGTLVYDTGTRAKVVHYWRMEAADEPSQPLMNDVRAVDWLPLDAAVARLSRDHEKTFLETVGPYALAGLIRKTRAKSVPEVAARTAVETAVVDKDAIEKDTAAVAAKPAAARKRRSRVVEEPAPAQVPEPVGVAVAESNEPSTEIAAAAPDLDQSEPVAWDATTAVAEAAETVATQPEEPETKRGPADLERIEAVAAAIKSLVPSPAVPQAEGRGLGERQTDMPNADAETAPREDADADAQDGPPRRSLAQKMRAWLGRAA
ncbi:putative NUDIX hydrolase [Bradyrhizobium oligotrophicum S58]|uniref:Putative NUDIX hydrolase n=1 Tax=Bradyrhizobium oligotrophicum S58 TaxID=1245469 RepID=M4Z463_9BRAD|nr:NUDIX hydrolase [Bradyrhizobium oligotrophicum]BAM87929.1 putative NUDIX hydrolase [Bradyrhizobium oligotrophicum S58]